MIFKVVTCFKLVFHIAVDVFQEVIAFNLLSKTDSICGEQLCTISIFRFDLVVVKVVHQRFANIEDAHTAIERLIEYQLRSLHMDFSDIFIEYSQWLKVWFCCKFQCFHVVFDLTHIHVFPDVFHRLSEGRDVHRLEEILFEVFFPFTRRCDFLTKVLL